MTYEDFKDITRRTASDKTSCNRTIIFLKMNVLKMKIFQTMN